MRDNLSFAKHPETRMLLFHLILRYSARLTDGKKILKGFLYKLVQKFDSNTIGIVPFHISEYYLFSWASISQSLKEMQFYLLKIYSVPRTFAWVNHIESSSN